MSDTVKLISIIGLFFIVTSCSTELDFPGGGYHYPAKLHQGARDSFKLAYYASYWRQAFNEDDLGIRPQKHLTVRLIYETAFGESSVFIMTQNEIVVKQVLEGSPYPNHDPTKLDQAERGHFHILNDFFPIQNLDSSNPGKIKASKK